MYVGLKYLPMEKLPGFKNDLGNFIYTIILTFIVITVKSKIIDRFANLIRAKHLGAEDFDFTISRHD